MYHVNNLHEWNGGKDSKFNECVHLTLPIEKQRSKKWLRSGSLVHSTLKNLVCNKNLPWNIKMLTGFQHTSALEVFHSVLLTHKRQHFSYVGMQAHIKLPILDHIYNTNRKQATTKKGM